MSQVLRSPGDGGDGHQGGEENECIRLAPIRFLELGERDWVVSVPRELVEQANRSKKHHDNLLYEIALKWRQSRRRHKKHRKFHVSMRMLNYLYNPYVRRVFKKILDSTATTARNHSNYPGNRRTRLYKFNNFGSKKAPTYHTSGSSIDSNASNATGTDNMHAIRSNLRTELIRVTIPGRWLRLRYLKKSAICEQWGWISKLDLDGRTEWGRWLFASLDRVSMPVTDETSRLTSRGVTRLAKRRYGRVYHPISNLRKGIRRECLIDGEPIAEVDIHACYTCLLVSDMHPGESRDKAIAYLMTDWYSQFDVFFAGWFEKQVECGLGYISKSGTRILRSGNSQTHDQPLSIKKEYSRQCLFWADSRDISNPLRVFFRSIHPELCDMIIARRKRMSASDLSRKLTQREGSIVVDTAMAEFARAGIAAIPLHDAVMVQASRATATQEILLDVCERKLGFRPKISIKSRLGSEPST